MKRVQGRSGSQDATRLTMDQFPFVADDCDALEQRAFRLRFRLFRIGRFLIDLTDEIVEDFPNVDLGLGAGLHEHTAPLARKILPLIFADHALVLEVTLVANKNDGDVFGILHAQDLITKVLQVVERRLRGDGIDEQEALAIFHVQVPHGCELFRAGSVENLQHALVAINLDLFPVAILDGRVVFFDEDTLHELHSEGTFSDTAAAQDY